MKYNVCKYNAIILKIAYLIKFFHVSFSIEVKVLGKQLEQSPSKIKLFGELSLWERRKLLHNKSKYCKQM